MKRTAVRSRSASPAMVWYAFGEQLWHLGDALLGEVWLFSPELASFRLPRPSARVTLKPLRYALWLALTYLVLAGGYILVSGRVAAAIARDIAELQRIESVKGLAFVVVTGLLLFASSWLLLLRYVRAEEIQSQERRALTLMQSKAYAAELAAAVAHDFNNVLMILRAGVDELAAECTCSRDSTTLDEMRRALASARDLTERMAGAARGARKEREQAHCLSTVVTDSVRLLRRLPRLMGRRIEVQTSSNAKVFLDCVLVEQILVNLLFNAADATGIGATILVEISSDEQWVSLSVHDSGQGLSDAALEKVLEPFTTTKATGLGLGLLSVRASVEASHGTLSVKRSPLGGAMFQVRWARFAES